MHGKRREECGAVDLLVPTFVDFGLVKKSRLDENCSSRLEGDDFQHDSMSEQVIDSDVMVGHDHGSIREGTKGEVLQGNIYILAADMERAI